MRSRRRRPDSRGSRRTKRNRDAAVSLQAEWHRWVWAASSSVPPRCQRGVGPRDARRQGEALSSLFRGREDVFPTRFVSKKTGKPGYAPACCEQVRAGRVRAPEGEVRRLHEPGVHARSTTRPSSRTSQGRHVMGVYPLLEDETCWFLAVDFDKSTWKEDVRAFVETCRRVGLPAAVERSRSGNGAHVWFFFSAPVPAATRAQDGLLPHHRDDGAPPRAQHGVLRPARSRTRTRCRAAASGT